MRTKCDECTHQYTAHCYGCAYSDKHGRPIYGNDPYDEDFNDNDI
jgi:hypothetical protein